jgi:hypothetical protein
MVYIARGYLLIRSSVKASKIPKVSQRKGVEFVRRHRVEIDLNDVSMLNLHGTAQVLLVTEGSGTSKAIKAALRRFYPAKGWRRSNPIPAEERRTVDRRRR